MRLLFMLSLSLLAFGCSSKEGKPCPADGSCGDELRCEPITKTCQSSCGKPADCKKGLNCNLLLGVCFSGGGGFLQNAKIDITRTAISQVEAAVHMYNLHFNEDPESMRNLTNPRGRKPYLKLKQVRDEWGNKFIYKRSSGEPSFIVYSKGPDGIEGTDDDIYNEKY